MFQFFYGTIQGVPANPWLPFVFTVLGGALTFGYQSIFRWLDRRRLRHERIRRLNATLFELFNSVHTLNKHLVGAVREQTPDDRRWSDIQIAPGLDAAPFRFPIDDTLVLTGPGAYDVVNQMRLIANRRNSVALCLNQYNVLRTQLDEAMVPHMTLVNGELKPAATYRNDVKVRLAEINANSLILQLIEDAREQKNLADALLPNYRAVMRRIAPDLKEGLMEVK